MTVNATSPNSRNAFSIRKVWADAQVPSHLARALVEQQWLLRPTRTSDAVTLRVAAVLVYASTKPGEYRGRKVGPPLTRDQAAISLVERAIRRTDVHRDACLVVWEDSAAMAESTEELRNLVATPTRVAQQQLLLPIGAWLYEIQPWRSLHPPEEQ